MARSLDLPYDPASRCEPRYAWFEAMRALGWAVFLDSGDPARSGGRYDILAAGPSAILAVDGDRFEAMRALLAGETSDADSAAWPVAGAAIGYLAYASGGFMPAAAVGLYPWTVVVDHRERRAAITSFASFTDEEALALRARLLEAATGELRAFEVTGPVRSSLEREAYLPRARRVLEYIAAGDCYQVNLTREFRAPCAGDPWTFYRYLHDTNPAPMGAYLEYPFGTVLSSSPERLLEVAGREVLTRPIKGTRRRRADPTEDAAAAAELLASEKDRAENVMIVDLLRNDLGRVCETGSVRVGALCELESFATVHHLVSTVTGRLAVGRDAFDALESCFPGGSITGAPKRRAMQIIDELEPHRREVYCGAIGYATPSGRLDMNIPIRTTLCAGGELRFYAGGGIVADSTAEDEFDETEAKIAAIRRAIAAFPPRERPRHEGRAAARDDREARRAARGRARAHGGVVRRIHRAHARVRRGALGARHHGDRQRMEHARVPRSRARRRQGDRAAARDRAPATPAAARGARPRPPHDPRRMGDSRARSRALPRDRARPRRLRIGAGARGGPRRLPPGLRRGIFRPPPRRPRAPSLLRDGPAGRFRGRKPAARAA
jgi:para-aminobenzoate synthetase component 1